MRYEINRKDRTIPGTRGRVRLIGETPEENILLSSLATDLANGVGPNYFLVFSSSGPVCEGGNFALGYDIKKKRRA
jgi:hypothetical protein